MLNELKQLKEQKGLTQKRIAEITGRTERMIRYYFSGKKPVPELILYRIRQEPDKK